jgi:hypothetical protein
MVAPRGLRGRRKVSVENITSEETVLTVTASRVGVPDEEKREVIDVRCFVTDTANVRVSAGVTKNLSNYEFLRIDVSISAPCYVEEIDEVRKRLGALVSDSLTEEVDAYLGE